LHITNGPEFHRFEADGLEPGSPAQAAGLLIEDVITAIDGRAATELNLGKIE